MHMIMWFAGILLTKNAGRLGLLVYLNTIFSIISDVTIFNETPGIIEILASCLIFLGIAISKFKN
jgi:drug/metabolite transporter (DMT)-like permease